MPGDLRKHSIHGIPETTTKGASVRRFMLATGVGALAAAVLVAGALATTTAKKIPFVGTYAGTAVTNAADNVVTISASGTGKGTLIGAGKIAGAGKGDSSQQPCVPFNGTGSMKGAGGVITFKVNPGSAGCGDEQGQTFTVNGKITVLKATGKLAKAKGTLKMTGTYDRSSGAFTVKFRGTLSK